MHTIWISKFWVSCLNSQFFYSSTHSAYTIHWKYINCTYVHQTSCSTAWISLFIEVSTLMRYKIVVYSTYLPFFSFSFFHGLSWHLGNSLIFVWTIGGLISEVILILDPLPPTKGAKWIPWAENLNFPPIKVNNLLKFSAQGSDFEPFISNGTKVKIPSAIKPPLFGCHVFQIWY